MIPQATPDATPQALFALTRELIDLESISGNERAVVERVAEFLRAVPGLTVETYDAEPGRPNVFAFCGRPRVVFSTHLDTVPPFFPCREDADRIWGRGACDAKGICAAQIFAALELLRQDVSDFGLLFVVGEERNSAGAMAANLRPPVLPAGTPRFLINGEPTESKLVSAGKGVLRLNLRATGRAAHSAYPELGESAIDKLLGGLDRLRRLPLPVDAELGPTTLNIGTLRGGRAPNVVADLAEAELLFRLVTDSAGLKRAIADCLAPTGMKWEYVLELPVLRLRTLPGFATATVAFGTDIPKLGAWGEALLFGPGSIHLAHTAEEHIRKAELAAAPGAYARLAQALLEARCAAQS